MENFEWSKTILTVYRYLKRMTFAYDRLIKSRAYNSFYTSSENYAFNNVFDISNSILDMTERKITLINLKVLIEKCLKTMDKSLARILVFKYIENRKCDEVAKMLNVCTRTYFRKLNLAHESFNRALSRFGYDNQKLEQMLKSEKWIMKTYEDFCISSENVEINEIQFEHHLKCNIYFELKRAMC